MEDKIYIMPEGAQWKVSCEHCQFVNLVATEAGAIKSAKQHFRSLPPGTIDQILLQRDPGRFTEINVLG
jgi:hypothetical protein